MGLIRKIPKAPKRSTRWRSQAHLNHVRSHACVMCGSEKCIEVAHVRLGSGAGMGQKPHDYLTVSLCKECHQWQHATGEVTFWGDKNPHDYIAEFIATSPKRREIEAHRNG